MAFESKSNDTLAASPDENMGVTFETLPGNVTNAQGYSIQAVWIAGNDLVGIMNLQASNDDINYSDIPNSSLPVASDADNNIFNVSKHVFYNYVRLKYTAVSGNGRLVVTMVSKG